MASDDLWLPGELAFCENGGPDAFMRHIIERDKLLRALASHPRMPQTLKMDGVLAEVPKSERRPLDWQNELVLARKFAGLRQADLASRMCVGRGTVGRLETWSPEKNVTVKTLQEYLWGCGCIAELYAVPLVWTRVAAPWRLRW